MIVKNEASVIARCLESVIPIIDHWIIVDTGSSDATQSIIRQILKNIPGALYEREWRDFAHNRSEALVLARSHGDYSLIIDADDALEYPQNFRLEKLTEDAYAFYIKDNNFLYPRTQLVNNRLTWRYRGVLHEFITTSEPHSVETLDVIMHRNHDGARRRDPDTYRRDAAVLEKALREETDPYLRTRYTFYLAQSYRDSGEPLAALKNYIERTKLGGWEEEVFFSFYQAGKIKEALGYPDEDTIETYNNASNVLPTRNEARYAAGRLCRIKKLYEQGYEVTRAGLDVPCPPGSLFGEPWIYETGLLDEFSVNAYWVGRYDECLGACLKLIESGKIQGDMLARVIANARASLAELSKPHRPKTLGSFGETAFVEQHRLEAQRNLASYLPRPPRVLIAILAKQKAAALPLYLKCIENLDYPKSSIVLYVRTNNNSDNTGQILKEWLERVNSLYAEVEFNSEDIEVDLEKYGVHEWNNVRFKALAEIRTISLRKTIEHNCDFYFVCDADNFIRANTLKELVALNLPIVAPFLRSVARDEIYSNFHGEIDAAGYYEACDQYFWIINRWVRGIFEVPVVHCTYLVRQDIIGALSYQDETERHEYVIFSESARKASVPQYFDNRQIYGYVAFDRQIGPDAENEFEAAKILMAAETSEEKG